MAIKIAPEILDEGLDWWVCEDETLAATQLCTDVSQINNYQTWRRVACMRYGQVFAGHSDGDGLLSASDSSGAPITLPRNVTRQAVNTVLPKVAKHRPMPQILTDHGNWSQQKRARKCTEFLNGEYDQQQIFEVHWGVAVRDALVFTDGLTRVDDVEDCIQVERVFPWEWFIDSFDGRYGMPRCAWHVRTMDLEEALVRYGKVDSKNEDDDEEKARARCAALRAAATTTFDPNWDVSDQYSSTRRRVRITDAWHLCSDRRAHASVKPKDHECTGRHMAVIQNSGHVLFDEVWEEQVFPVVQLNFQEPLAGSRGIGLVRQMEPWQDRITNQSDKVDDAHRIGGGVMIMKQSGSGVVEAQISNEGPVMIVEYDGGTMPQAQVLPTCDPSVYQREQDLPMQALSEQGISLQSAAGMKHPGVNSGIGIETIDDIEDERWTMFGRAAEKWSMQIGKRFLACARRIAKREGEYAVQVKMSDKGSLTRLTWSQVSLNDFQVRVFPSSVLPQQVGNRLDKLWMMFNAGIIDRLTFLQQMGAPDLNAEIDIVTAMRLNIDEKLQGVIDAETTTELRIAVAHALPSSYLDFKWMQLRAQLRIMQEESKGCPQENISALRNICDACQVLIEGETPAPAAAQPLAPGLQSGAPPGATPPPVAGVPMPMNPHMQTGTA